MKRHDCKYLFVPQTVSSMPFVVAILVSISLPWSNQTHAREWLGLTGLELAEQSNTYAFAGVVAPLDSNTALGQGWVQRYWLDWVKYRFDSGGEEVRARAPGFSASLGYQQSNSTGFWAAYAGAGYRDTTLTPDRPAVEVRGSHSSLQLLAELDSRFAKDWRFAGAVQYSAGPDSYWSRAKFLNKLSTVSFWHGIEFVFQGDPDYKAYKIGLVLDELPVGNGVTANFKVGVNKTKGLNTIGYVGIEFVGIFGNK
ncbi:MAG: cellulose biosynthesis protein BcsS [Sulfuricaulis sp.]|uniref:cellulose biosynthesis protein BcsS n=1 Tax=Sulfuricaulis sp. TaxID=2003553 RepID=UPI0025F11574|nr:cellulose biosynthesis protein BcsS [Sulfuricaulis sp.]MCR4345816.1 cellulose biosynthesis protein BcsS [Sulfuricaulis sp.]